MLCSSKCVHVVFRWRGKPNECRETASEKTISSWETEGNCEKIRENSCREGSRLLLMVPKGFQVRHCQLSATIASPVWPPLCPFISSQTEEKKALNCRHFERAKSLTKLLHLLTHRDTESRLEERKSDLEGRDLMFIATAFLLESKNSWMVHWYWSGEGI